MRLATIKPSMSGAAELHARDGQLAIVRHDGLQYAPVPLDIAPHLQGALDEWEATLPKLRSIAHSLERGTWPDTRSIEHVTLLAPLPRSPGFLDGSAFLEHVHRARKARGAAIPADLEQIPLMYQGKSDNLVAPTAPWELRDEGWDLDFEAEIGVIVGDVPEGVSSKEAEQLILLVVILNDFTYRALVPSELQRGFGFVQSKPASSFGGFAVTPDELAEGWQDSRVHAHIVTQRNGQLFGKVHGGEMHFSFADLIAHAARTRPLSAGTIIGSGTVANSDPSRGFSCIVEKRAFEQIETGAPQTAYLKRGERIEIYLELPDGRRPCGTIAHRIQGSS